MTYNQLPHTNGGTRISSHHHRHLNELNNDFTGLEEGINRYDLLLLVKKVGRLAGFTSRMIELLDYYMAFTRDIDWQEGSNPIVYQSHTKTSLDLGISERQINRIEKELFNVGAITWQDSGNHKRYGHRNPETGQIIFAYGVDLTPLAYLRASLEEKLAHKKLYDQAWLETKRQISFYRAQIRQTLEELSLAEIKTQQVKEEILQKRIRTSLSLEQLIELKKEHEIMFETLSKETQSLEDNSKMSATVDKNVRHIQSTIHKKSNKLDTSSPTSNRFQETSKKSEAKHIQTSAQIEPESKTQETKEDLILNTGLQHISLKQVLNICSEEARAHIPLEPRPMNWRDLVEAGYKLKSLLGISQNSWGRACLTLGQNGAAICVFLTDQATRRRENAVRKPAAYFNAMLNRAKKGELKLHQSVFGLLKRD